MDLDVFVLVQQSVEVKFLGIHAHISHCRVADDTISVYFAIDISAVGVIISP